MQRLKYHTCQMLRATGSWLRWQCAQLLNRADNIRRCLRASSEWAAACLFRHGERSNVGTRLWALSHHIYVALLDATPAAPHLNGTR
jgi:hypothetical protein